MGKIFYLAYAVIEKQVLQTPDPSENRQHGSPQGIMAPFSVSYCVKHIPEVWPLGP